MKDENEICGISLENCTKDIGYINIVKMTDGTELKIGVHIIVGINPGPILCIISTCHGNETLGIDVSKKLVNEINLNDLSGVLVIIPVANPISFQSGTRNTPIDMLNLNRVFPGNKEGYLTEKIAYYLVEEVIKKVDCIISIHGGDEIISNNFGFYMSPAEELQKVFGHQILFKMKSNMFGSSLTEYAISELGIPAIVSEIGASPKTALQYTEQGFRGVMNVMKHLKMIEGKPEKTKNQILVNNRIVIRATNGGIYYPEYGTEKVGSIIPKDTILGTIVDPQTFENIQTIKAPYGKNILMLCRERSKVLPGDYVFTIGDIDTAEKLT